ncbi:MAG: hypothetical protein IRY95_03560 [Clostridia bacterium]|nr:hypothetical protein [Clostridia bacterium]
MAERPAGSMPSSSAPTVLLFCRHALLAAALQRLLSAAGGFTVLDASGEWERFLLLVETGRVDAVVLEGDAAAVAETARRLAQDGRACRLLLVDAEENRLTDLHLSTLALREPDDLIRVLRSTEAAPAGPPRAAPGTMAEER